MSFYRSAHLAMGGALTFMSVSLGITGVYNSVSARNSINACAQQTIETSACDARQISKYSRQAEITASDVAFTLSFGGMGAGFIMIGAAAPRRRRKG